MSGLRIALAKDMNTAPNPQLAVLWFTGFPLFTVGIALGRPTFFVAGFVLNSMALAFIIRRCCTNERPLAPIVYPPR